MRITKKDHSGQTICNREIVDVEYLDCFFTVSRMTRVVFKNVIFRECVFNHSRMHECTFENCKFIWCDMRHVQMTGVIFSKCHLEKVNMVRVKGDARYEDCIEIKTRRE